MNKVVSEERITTTILDIFLSIDGNIKSQVERDPDLSLEDLYTNDVQRSAADSFPLQRTRKSKSKGVNQP